MDYAKTEYLYLTVTLKKKVLKQDSFAKDWQVEGCSGI